MAVSLLGQTFIEDNSSPVSGLYTAASGTSERLLVVVGMCQGDSQARTVTAATFGAMSFTQAVMHNEQVGNGNPCLYIGYIKNADIPTGSQTVSLTWSGGSAFDAWVFTLDGVDQSTPVRATGGDSATSEGALNAITLSGTQAGDYVICVGQDNDSSAPTIPSGYSATSTATAAFSTTSTAACALKAISATADETFDFTSFGSARVGQAGVAFAGAATGLSITSVTPSSFDDGRTGIVIAGSGFGASQGSSTLTIGGQAQTVTAWSDTSITFTSVRGSNSMGARSLTLTRA